MPRELIEDANGKRKVDWNKKRNNFVPISR
jgi:hypothetical protein